jgi:hypothetical protein
MPKNNDADCMSEVVNCPVGKAETYVSVDFTELQK